MNNFSSSVKYLFEKFRPDSYYDTARQHTCYELVYCTEGTGCFCINNVNIPFRKGTYCVVSPSSFFSETGCSTSCFYLGFNYEDCHKEIPCGLFVDEDGKLLNIITDMQHEILNHKLFFEQCIESLLKELLYNIKRSNSPLAANSAHFTSSLLLDIVAYFHKNYSQQIDIPVFFESFGYSYHHLRHFFKELYSLSPTQYLTKIRIDNAKKLLLTTSLSTEEIRKKCGFNSHSHFISTFKKHTNMTPNDFRLKGVD